MIILCSKQVATLWPGVRTSMATVSAILASRHASLYGGKTLPYHPDMVYSGDSVERLSAACHDTMDHGIYTVTVRIPVQRSYYVSKEEVLSCSNVATRRHDSKYS